MSSTSRSSTVMLTWVAVGIAITAVVAFTGGYFVGTIVTDVPEGFTIVDDYGRTVEIDGIPERIVSVAPTPTEILFAIGAGPQVVGVDNYSDYPEEARDLPQVGDFELNSEVIIALNPDLIIAGDLVPRAQLEQLADDGIPYVLFADRTLEDVFKTIRLAGIITGHVEEADSLATSLSERVDTVTAKTLDPNVTKPKVFVEYYVFGSSIWTFGPGSFGDDLIELAGGKNIAHNTSSEYPIVESEFVIAQNPDIIVYAATSTTKADIISTEGWGNITAVVEDKVYSIDDNLISRYGPRIVDGLEQLAAMIHPELFS